MLWVVLANVSGGDWAQQSAEWQEAAARWRDNYFRVHEAAHALEASVVSVGVTGKVFQATPCDTCGSPRTVSVTCPHCDALEASSEAPQAGPVVNGGGNHYDNPATWAKEASPTVDREAPQTAKESR
jgi:hypothetical protein